VLDLNILENIEINSGVNSAAHSSVKLSSFTLVGKRSKIIAVKFLVLSQNFYSNPSSSAMNLITWSLHLRDYQWCLPTLSSVLQNHLWKNLRKFLSSSFHATSLFRIRRLYEFSTHAFNFSCNISSDWLSSEEAVEVEGVRNDPSCFNSNLSSSLIGLEL